MHFLRWLTGAFVVATLGPGALQATEAGDQPPDLLMGHTELRIDLPGGRYVNVATFRAVIGTLPPLQISQNTHKTLLQSLTAKAMIFPIARASSVGWYIRNVGVSSGSQRS